MYVSSLNGFKASGAQARAGLCPFFLKPTALSVCSIVFFSNCLDFSGAAGDFRLGCHVGV